MCGIFGHTHPERIGLEQSRTALHMMKHRGPDQWDEWRNDKIYLGHRRLSILDLSEQGKQPMRDNTTGVVISINGEVYNFQGLKKELKEKYPFKSTSDSEVVLYAYIEWGLEELLERIDGMYAITIYDPRIQKCFLVRDRSGIKPLFYGKIKGVYAWASELKGIQKLFENNLEIDNTAIYDFLTYLYIPSPKTIHKNIYKLLPGTYLSIDLLKNESKVHRYWQLEVRESAISLEEAKGQLLHLLDQSVKEQLISDVPIGFFLSGGIDSSTIVAMAAKHVTTPNTYTIGFEDKGKDESGYSQTIAELFKTNHTLKLFDGNYGNLLDQIFDWYDEPYGDTSAMPTFLVSELAKKSSTVVLTGDGGDELFGGYSRYFSFREYKRKPKLHSSFAKRVFKRISNNSPNFLKGGFYRIENNFLLNDFELYTKMMGGMMTAEKEIYRIKLGIPQDYDDYWYYRQYYREDLDIVTRLQYLDFHTYLHDDILTKVDRASMQVSLESRVPYLSKEIIEFAFSLPEAVRLSGMELKGIVKKAFEPILPKEILYRKKAGFSVPNSFIFDRTKNKQSKPERLLYKYNEWDEGKKLQFLLEGII